MRALKGAIAVAVVAAGCGSAKTNSTTIGPTGGEVCLNNDKICITVPPGALERNITIRIALASNLPAGAFGAGYDIGPSGTRFLKPAKIVFDVEQFFAEDSPVDPLLLRLYTRYDGDWEAVATPVPTLDRVRHSLSGTVIHLSPFVVIRGDLLPDGGTPIEYDGGK